MMDEKVQQAIQNIGNALFQRVTCTGIEHDQLKRDLELLVNKLTEPSNEDKEDVKNPSN